MKNNRLKQIREKQKITQAEVAKKAKITETSYQNYEAGRRKPKVNTAILIAKALNSTVEALFDGGISNNIKKTNKNQTEQIKDNIRL